MKARGPTHLRPSPKSSPSNPFLARPPISRPTFSRPLDIKRVPEGGLEQSIAATATECAAVAADLGLLRVAALSARLAVDRRAGGRFDVSGTVEAEITQICVVTLDPFDSAVEHPVAITFAPAVDPVSDRAGRAGHHGRSDAGRVVAAPVAAGDEAVDPPDPLFDDTIDLGAVATEFLALALDPYPRKPGVEFADVTVDELSDPKPSAFAALERLKEGS